MSSLDENYPAPPHMSEHARTVLSRPRGTASYPPKDDIGAWKAWVRAADSMLAERFGGLSLPVVVEEREIGGVPVFLVRPEGLADPDSAPIYLDVHGGGLIMGGGELAATMGAFGALQTGMVHWTVDYRMPPEHPYPAALDDLIAVYEKLLEVRTPDQIVVGGGSAGGNLAAALLLKAKDDGLPMPAAAILLTPEADLTESGDSFTTLARADNVLGSLKEVNDLYAAGHDLRHPYLSPLFGDLTAFPPTLVQAGTRDLYLSNAVRLHRKLRESGVEAELHVFEAMPHGGFGGAPEDAELTAEIQRFIAKHLAPSA